MCGASASEDGLPGVVLLGVDSQIGLSIVRELGRHGVPVYGIAKSRQAVGLHSRYLRHGYVHQGRDGALIDLIRDIARTNGAAFVMTVSEGDIVFLNRRRDELQSLRLLIPDRNAIEFVIDKSRVYALAETLGIRVPVSVFPDSSGEVAKPEALEYPVILKWSDPNGVSGMLREAGLPLHKAEYCHSPVELEVALARYRPIGRYPLVQSYCPGHGLGQMILMHDGEPVLRFQHRRLHEWPPEGGFSTLCESLPPDGNPDLMAKSVALLRAINWEGPAMVEYRHDPATDQSVLMEINGRFWGSLPLAYHARAEFAWGLYRTLGIGESSAAAGDYRVGMRCRFMLPDLKRLFRIAFQPGKIADARFVRRPVRDALSFLLYPIMPASRHYIFSIDDPMPAAYEIVGRLNQAWNVVKPHDRRIRSRGLP